VPTNTPPAATNTPVPTNTPTVTLTATLTPTPCPLTVSLVYAERELGSGQRNIYVRVLVTDACTGAPVTGATVTAPGLSFTPQAGGYQSCTTKIGASPPPITVSASLGNQNGSATFSVTTTASAGCH
jgi:hypothetical protein